MDIDLLREFSKHLEFERGQSKATVTSYHYSVRGYLAYLGERGLKPGDYMLKVTGSIKPPCLTTTTLNITWTVSITDTLPSPYIARLANSLATYGGTDSIDDL